MRNSLKVIRYLLVVTILVLSIVTFVALSTPRIGNTFSSISNCLDCTAFAVPTALFDATEDMSSSGGEEPLAEVDEILKKSIPASIAYNAPAEMRLNETVAIELLLNPSISEKELEKQVSESGEISTSTIQISPQMKAEIFSQDPEAFSVRGLHAAPIQIVSGAETTKWSWYVTAKKEGTHRLTIIMYRLVKFEGQEFWREVQTYKSDINIKVTLLNRLQSLGWGWFVGLLLVLAAVPFVRRMNLRMRNGLRQRSRRIERTRPAVDYRGQIFISYRRSDSADITGRIYDRLVDEFGRTLIFKDVDSIPLGTDFKEYLDRKVGECDVLLAIVGADWLDSRDAGGNRRLDDPADFVRVEIESALERDIPVIPILVRGAHMPVERDLPAGLQKLVYKNGIQVRPDPDFHRDMDRLISALNDYIR